MDNTYNRLSPKMMWQLAAPHTWPASIFPVLLAVSVTLYEGIHVRILLAFSLLLISVMLQSSVNVLNDYFDFVKGADSADDNVEESDAVLVYNNIDPKSARNFAIVLILASLGLGCYCIYMSGPFCLAIAAVGILVVFLYSGGKTPISYLPIGEAVSGFVMGGLITYASHAVLTGNNSPLVLLWSTPLILNIALIMLTNNGCDIEKDKASNRRTLPVLIGRPASVKLYKTLVIASYVLILLFCAIWFKGGLIIAPFFLLGTYPVAVQLLSASLEPGTRIASMGRICTFNIASGAFYCAMVLAGNLAFVL